jgi:hypothetical protein
MAEQRAERQMAHLFCTYADGRKKELAAIEKRSGSECEHPAARCHGELIEEQAERIRPMSRCVPFSEVWVIEPGDPAASEIKIDPKFQSLVPAISDDERKQLEANIVEHGGARDPLTVWLRGDDDEVLLDGHNRYEICTRLGLRFQYFHVVFETRDEAADWIDRNQLGRRNLDARQMSLLRGRRYNRTKKAPEDAGALKGKGVDKMSTASALAAEHGVNEKTIRRDGEFAEAVETLGIEREIVAGEIDSTRREIAEAAAALPDKPTADEIKQARETVKAATAKRRSGKQAAKPTAGESRRKNGGAADRITKALITLRNAVESLAETDSKYRDQSLAELQRHVGHLSRPQATTAAKPDKARPDDELRAAVVKRWGAMREWDKHWGITDMKDVRRLFIEVIREDQKQFDK